MQFTHSTLKCSPGILDSPKSIRFVSSKSKLQRRECGMLKLFWMGLYIYYLKCTFSWIQSTCCVQCESWIYNRQIFSKENSSPKIQPRSVLKRFSHKYSTMRSKCFLYIKHSSQRISKHSTPLCLLFFVKPIYTRRPGHWYLYQWIWQ